MSTLDAGRPCISCKHHDLYGGEGPASERMICTLPAQRPSVAFERDDVIESGRAVPKCGPAGLNWQFWGARK